MGSSKPLEAWYGKISKNMIFHGYFALVCESPKVNGRYHIASNDDTEVAKPHGVHSNQFDIKDLKELIHFLDLEAENVKGGLFLPQEGHREKNVLQI